MPDLNYGDLSSVESNACFQDLAASADKWINMGVDGFRLDAVKHICGGHDSYSHASNRKLLKKWYEHCNATYKAAGHSDNIFMVAEEWDSHSTETQYYESLTSCFEFDYGSMLSDALNNRKGSSYASAVIKYVTDHEAKRSDAVTSLFLTNHDQDRWSEWVGRSLPKQKQAAAMLLTSAGKPFVYMGEELGYTGKKTGDSDVPRRMPMAWDSNLSHLAKYGLDNNHKNDNTDYSVVKGAISVAAQEADAGSLLNVYKTWSRLRNTYPALADGKMSEHETLNKNSSSPIAAWYMTSGNQKLLVIHNLGSETAVTVSNDLSHPIALLGTASVSGKTLKLGANSSVVFQL
jgi:glycosidase